MRPTIFLYLTKHFLKSFLIVLAIIAVVIFFSDLVESVRKSTQYEHLYFAKIIYVSLSAVPYFVQETYPFIIFLSAVYSFIMLARYNEYTIIKGAGISVWQFLIPYLVNTFIISIIIVTIVNPIAVSLLIHREKIKPDNHFSATLLSSGFWLVDRTTDKNNLVIIDSERLLITPPEKAELFSTSFTYLSKDYAFIKTFTTESAFLENGKWILLNAKEYVPQNKIVLHEKYVIPTQINVDELQNSFTSPQYTSVWNLPYLIYVLKTSGVPAKKYVAYFYKLISRPFMTISLLFIGAIFALRPIRIFNPTRLVLLTVIIVFIMHFFTELIFASGLNNSILAPEITALLIAVIINVIAILSLQYFEYIRR